MEQNKVENYVVYVNRSVIKNLVIWGVVLCALLFLSQTIDALFLPSIAFVGYLASNLMIILITGLRLPGYQAALAQYSGDKAAKKVMIANYDSIKATKPFALSNNKHLISVGVGIVCAGLVYLALITG